MKFVKKIIITGPESTGKTTLAKQLAKEFSTSWIPEYARNYIEKLNRNYTLKDLVKIAEKQRKIHRSIENSKENLIFFDTGLIITKIWFLEIYKTYPDWIDTFLSEQKNTTYILCKPDIEWKSDSVRENGGKQRQYLYNRYKEEIMKYNFPFFEIEGTGNLRFLLAKKLLKTFFVEKKWTLI